MARSRKLPHTEVANFKGRFWGSGEASEPGWVQGTGSGTASPHPPPQAHCPGSAAAQESLNSVRNDAAPAASEPGRAHVLGSGAALPHRGRAYFDKIKCILMTKAVF